MKIKDVVKSRRNWIILGFALLQIFQVNIPTEIQQILTVAMGS